MKVCIIVVILNNLNVFIFKYYFIVPGNCDDEFHSNNIFRAEKNHMLVKYLNVIFTLFTFS